jgi:hypothetical protein
MLEAMPAPLAMPTPPAQTGPPATPTPRGEPAPLAWARSGAMALSGEADGPPSAGPAALAAHADALAAELCVRWPARVPLDGAALLGERAAWLGLERRGRVSPGGGCRLLPTADGFLAANLARPDDVALLPAWLERPATGDPWRTLEDALPERPTHAWVERGRLLGLPVAEAVAPAACATPAVRVAARGVPRPRPIRRTRVLDLSSLWAGPLCTQLLAAAGARVVKVESTTRPDGARRGPAPFFDLLNAGKASVALDLGASAGRDALRRLLAAADVVVEASRPRALRQLGIDAEAWVAEVPGRVWVSITGHGRRPPADDWVAFGDDAGVAAGLAFAAGDASAPVFCADAAADPLTGLRAAVEIGRALECGGGRLLDVSLVGVAREALGDGACDAPPARVVREDGAWWVTCDGRRERVAPPRSRRPRGRARALGADGAAWDPGAC